jgi:hypothetical protein
MRNTCVKYTDDLHEELKNGEHIKKRVIMRNSTLICRALKEL